MRAFLAAATVLVMAAGCLEPPVDDSDPAGAGLRQASLPDAQPDDGSGAATDAFLLRAAVGPEAPLTGFAWRLPEDALHASELYDGEALTLQFLPLGLGRQQAPLGSFVVALFE